MKSSVINGFAIFITLAYLMVGCVSHEESPITEQERASIADTILVLSKEANNAWQNLDAEAYLNYYSPEADFYFQGSYYSYNEFSNIVYDYLGSLQESSLTMIDPNIDVLGSRGAVISYEYTGHNMDSTGRADSTHAAFTAVFKKEKGEWLIIQAHESMVPAESDG